MKKTVIIGRGDIAVSCLDYLAVKNQPPVLIICDIHDNGKDSWNKSLFKKAKQLGFLENTNLFRVKNPNKPSFIKKLKTFKPDIIFSLQPKAIFGQDFINCAKDAVINFHFAPLPKLRGVATCSWAIVDGLDEMGVTAHLILAKGVDDGPSLFQKKFPIDKKDTAWSLFNKCIEHGVSLFKKYLSEMLKSSYKPKEQNNDEATYHSLGEFDFNRLTPDLNKPADQVDRFIRSRIFPPIQTPHFKLSGKIINILESEILDSKTQHFQPNIKKIDEGYLLECSRGSILVSKFKVKRCENG